MCRDAIRLVSEQILTILIAHARGTKPVTKRVSKIMDPNLWQLRLVPREFPSPVQNALRRPAPTGEDELGVFAPLFVISPKVAIAAATRSGKPVPGTAARAMLLQVSGPGERFQVILDRVSVGAGRFRCFGNGDAPALATQFKNPDR